MPNTYEGQKIISIKFMGNEILGDSGGGSSLPDYDTPAEWMANLADLKIAADDISANGTDSEYYAKFNTYMTNDETFPVQLQNVDSYTSVSEDKIMNCRIVGINFKDKADGSGKAGLTFMAKRAHPCADVMNISNSTTGGYPSMSLRTNLNSGNFWNSLPADLQSVIAQVTNVSRGPSGQVTSSDKLWLPSWYELCGFDSLGYDQTNDGPQFPWFATKGTTNSAVMSTLVDMCKTNSGANPYASESSIFWTRSVCPGSTSTFVVLFSYGDRSNAYPNSGYSILPCFSI